MEIKTLFLSYSWKTFEQANKIFQDLAIIGIKVIKDDHQVKAFGNLPDFMKKISEADCSILLISDGYLKSRHCLLELLIRQQSDINLEKSFPITVGKKKYFSIKSQVKYIQHWQNEKEKLKAILSVLRRDESTEEQFKESDLIKKISSLIGKFLSLMSNKKWVKYDDLIEQKYLPILEALGIQATAHHLIELLAIAFDPNPRFRLEKLNEFRKTYGPNSFFYGIRARAQKEVNSLKEAELDYRSSIKLFPENFESLNNLGFLLEYNFQKTDEARTYYREALKFHPYLTEARLNLGVNYSKINEFGKAKEQYEFVVSYEPTNEKAHSNLGSIYKSPEYFDLDKARVHLNKAIELNPKFVNGLMNYANFLKLSGEIEKGNMYYKKARKYSKAPDQRQIIDILLKSNKG